MLNATKSKKKNNNILPMVSASLLDLYVLSKKYHLHVTGPTFYGDHKTYDGIAEVSLEWFDTVAEYMRGRGESVPCDPDEVRSFSHISFDTVDDARSMLQSMQANLQCLISCMQKSYESG
ncbi:MAG: ferritin-like domain-containing protein, partial [Cetobacterium sp.]|uniref:ferritin-like domain-containing protein n=1 Tax=Cetobacterium sp. TaxID=2071632 RepID=UPI003EE787B6